MKTIGIEEFQEQRKEIMQRIIHQSCQELFDEKQVINPKNVAIRAKLIFTNEKIHDKYFVGEQSIGRSLEYRGILEKYKNTQKSLNLKRNKSEVSKQDAFDFRDRYDLLSQDYIELLDKYKWLERQHSDLQKVNSSLEIKISRSNVVDSDSLSCDLQVRSIIDKLKELVNIGATVILKSDNTVIIKSYLSDENKRYEVPLELWDKF